jgi:aspartate aminotransferase-like enzyme
MLEYQIKIAAEPQEIEQIHRLNYKTFVEEIPQHPPNNERRIIDKYHDENTYVICLIGDQLVGMAAVRNRRPFSLDAKVPDLDCYLPPFRSVCEIRLLAIEPQHRNGQVFGGLFRIGIAYGLGLGYDLAIISGTVRQVRLYKHMGFVSFGPLVGAENAQFQPMYLTLERFRESVPWFDFTPSEKEAFGSRELVHTVNLLPGPVNIHHDVLEAFRMPPISHRSTAFLDTVKYVKGSLCQLVEASNVEILLGSGTLTNDLVAAYLSHINRPGLVPSNGEFGERLIDQAMRTRLRYDTVLSEWGSRLDYDLIEKKLAEARYGWLWAVHCETSTGVLNDLERLKAICGRHRVRLCLDAVSSIGTVPVDLGGVYLATGVSGKGLASVTGLGFVFYIDELLSADHNLPRYFDLSYYANNEGVPFTSSSNLVAALHKALDRLKPDRRFQEILNMSAWLRKELRSSGFQLMVDDEIAMPSVVSVVLPDSVQSGWLGDCLREQGYILSYQSKYLLNRNIVQIVFMGEIRQESIIPLVDAMSGLVQESTTA